MSQIIRQILLEKSWTFTYSFLFLNKKLHMIQYGVIFNVATWI